MSYRYQHLSKNILDRFGDNPDFRSHDIKIDEVTTLANALTQSLNPYTLKLAGTTLNLYNGLQKWMSGQPRQDRVYNLRAYLYELAQNLIEFGLDGEPINPNEEIPF